MAKEQFADRLKLAMEHKGLKQVDKNSIEPE